jgi:hypothetical protein
MQSQAGRLKCHMSDILGRYVLIGFTVLDERWMVQQVAYIVLVGLGMDVGGKGTGVTAVRILGTCQVLDDG